MLFPSVTDVVGEVNTTLTVRIIDVIDEVPRLIVTPVTVPEELPVGTAIDGGFMVVDQDRNDSQHFFLAGRF